MEGVAGFDCKVCVSHVSALFMYTHSVAKGMAGKRDCT